MIFLSKQSKTDIDETDNFVILRFNICYEDYSLLSIHYFQYILFCSKRISTKRLNG
ncbi:hypothetical protein CHRYSEO8AT_440103 [Chryseobacterium sp. 8AT]|nr:hypothetical protein CHRYSEO8AT_440103 [Chryseobacterium sp. 8AT]